MRRIESPSAISLAADASRRGWRRKPASISAASIPEPITGSPSMRSTASFSIWPACAASASAREALDELAVVEPLQAEDPLAAALDVESGSPSRSIT